MGYFLLKEIDGRVYGYFFSSAAMENGRYCYPVSAEL